MSQSERNLVLVGFMGTGKTTVGKILAKRMKRRFLDMDRMIENREHMPISEMFASQGEATFRGLESSLALELSVQTNRVIACGGGIVLNPANLIALGMTGFVVCLSADAETILERVARSKKRPLLEGEEPDAKAERVRSLLAARQELYNAIKYQVPTDGLSLEEVAAKVEALYHEKVV